MASNVVQYVRQQVRTSLQDMTRYFREKKNESLWFQLSSHETEEKNTPLRKWIRLIQNAFILFFIVVWFPRAAWTTPSWL